MEQTAERIRFDFLPGLPIVVEPMATLMSSDAGILPIRQFDDQTCPEPRRVGFTERFVAGLHDPSDPALIDPRPEPRRNGFDEMVRRRIYGILAGYAELKHELTAAMRRSLRRSQPAGLESPKPIALYPSGLRPNPSATGS